MSDDANWVTIPSFHDQDVKKKGNIINAHHGSKSSYKYGNGNGNENRGKNRKSNNSRNGEKFPRDHRLRNNNRTSGFLASRSQPHTTNGIHSPHHNHSQLQNPVTKGSHNMPHQPPRSSLQKQAASFTPWSNRSSLMNANLSANANANANHVNARIPNRVDANSIPRARANANTNAVAAIPIAMYTNYRPQSQTISQTNYPPLQSQTYTERAPAQSDYAYRSNGSGTGKISAPQSYNNPHNSILNEGVGFHSSIVKNGSDFPNFPPLSNSVALSQSSMTPETNYNHLGNHGGINPITRSPPLAQSVSEPYRKHGGWAQIPAPQNYQILHHPEQRNQNTNHKKKKVMAGAGAGTGANSNQTKRTSNH